MEFDFSLGNLSLVNPHSSSSCTKLLCFKEKYEIYTKREMGEMMVQSRKLVRHKLANHVSIGTRKRLSGSNQGSKY
jgi:hypothetical protein